VPASGALTTERMTERERWTETWNRLGAVAPEALLAELVGRYSEPHRFYHTLQHLRECFSVLEPASHLAGRLAEVQLAARLEEQAHKNLSRSLKELLSNQSV
jgi:predicted metal-dependent HD superfamily phosphohydrolase